MKDCKTITLCADDYGLNQGVSEGILELAHKKRLSALSCMTNMTGFNKAPKPEGIELGLHLNLTEGYFLSQPDKACFGLKELLINSHLRRISPTLITQELNAQLDRYIEVMGAVPDFIDGHQHIHQFPIIRALVLQLYNERLREHGTYIRSTYPAITLPPFRVKAAILAWTGGRIVKNLLQQQAIPHHSFFSGVYDFSPGTDYRALFRAWLRLVPDDTLIMCHPGKACSVLDGISATRQIERAYFSSDAFIDDCEEFAVVLATSPKA